MSRAPQDPAPPPWANRDLPRAPLRLTRGGHSASRAGPSLLATGTGFIS